MLVNKGDGGIQGQRWTLSLPPWALGTGKAIPVHVVCLLKDADEGKGIAPVILWSYFTAEREGFTRAV